MLEAVRFARLRLAPALGVVVGLAALTLWVFGDILWSPVPAVPFGSDVLLYLWNCWHVDRAVLVERVSPYFTRSIMYPVGTSLIFHTIGLSSIVPWLPVLALMKGSAAAIAVYNAEILTGFVLAGVGAYVLARGEGADRSGALVASVLFSFSAHRLSQLGWADLLSAHYLLFYLVCLLRTVRRAGVWMPLCAGLLLALVAYNSFTQLYLAFLLTPALVLTERQLTREALGRLTVLLSVAAVLIGPLFWLVYREYFSAAPVWPPLGAELISTTSADPRDFLLPHHLPSVRGEFPCAWFPDRCGQLRGMQAFYADVGGGAFFIGSSVGHSLLLLTLAAAIGGRRDGAWRWIAIGAGCLVLSLGPVLRFTGEEGASGVQLPYAWLRHLPGFSMSKNPDRFVMPAVLCWSVAAAFGVGALAGWARGKTGQRWRAAVARLLAVGIVVAECCAARPSVQPLDAAPFAKLLARDPGDYAVVYYPMAGMLDQQYGMWEQITHGKRLLTGFLARVPYLPAMYDDPAYGRVFSFSAAEAPVAEQIDALGALVQGPRYRVKWLVVLHDAFARRQQRDEVLFHLSVRYPLVWSGRVTFSGLLTRYRDQSVFYVGAAVFEATLRKLERDAEELQDRATVGSSPAAIAAARVRLSAAWAEFIGGSTAQELATPELTRVEALVEAALGNEASSQ